MEGRLDPPHDRVRLTWDEVRALDELERLFAEAVAVPGRQGGDVELAGPSLGVRARVLAACLRWVRLGPVLVPVGLVLMVAALSTSVLLSAVGAVLVALGLGCLSGRPWVRSPLVWLLGPERDPD